MTAIDAAVSSITPPTGPRVGDRVQQPGGAPGSRQMPGEHHVLFVQSRRDEPAELRKRGGLPHDNRGLCEATPRAGIWPTPVSRSPPDESKADNTAGNTTRDTDTRR